MKHLSSIWRNLKNLYLNIVLAVVLIGGFVFAAGFGLCLYFARNNAEDMTKKSVTANLDLLHTYIDERLVGFENLLLSCYWAENRDYTIMYTNDVATVDDVQLCTELTLNLSSDVCGVALALEPPYYGLPEGRFGFCMVSSNVSGRTQTVRLDSIRDYRADKWYSKPMSLGKSCWIEPYRAYSYDAVVTTFALPIVDPELNPTGIFELDVNINSFIKRCESIFSYDGAKIFVIDGDNRYVVHEDSSKIFTRIEDDPHNADLVDHIKSSNRGVIKLSAGKTKSLLCYDKIPRTGWTVCVECSYDAVYRESAALAHKLTAISAISIVLLALCFIFIFERLKKITMKKASMESDLNVAKNVQSGILPKRYPAFPDRIDVDVYGFQQAAASVGGDLYDYIVRDNQLCFCIGDVSGKGVPASLYMFVVTTYFHNKAQTMSHPSEFVSALNKVMLSENNDFTFCTLFVGMLDMKTGLLEYCNAGHEAPIIACPDIDGNTSVRFLDVYPNVAVGVLADFPYKDQICALQPGDTIFLFTDGVTEAENPQKKLFGIDATLETVRQVCGEDSLLIDKIDAIFKKIQHHAAGVEQSDDITMLMVKYNGCTIVLENKVEQLPRLAAFAENICRDLSIDDADRNDFLVAIDELGANICMYAYPQDEENTFTVSFRQDDDELAFMFEDAGVPFDPTKTEDVDVDAPAEKRRIGGLGIYMVRQMMDRVEYWRVGDRNLLTIAKKRNKNN